MIANDFYISKKIKFYVLRYHPLYVSETMFYYVISFNLFKKVYIHKLVQDTLPFKLDTIHRTCVTRRYSMVSQGQYTSHDSS